MTQKLIQTKCPAWRWALLVYAVTLSSACKTRVYQSPPDYDLENPRKMELGKVLNEISGIIYIGNGNILAVSDSKEKVVRIDLKNTRLFDYTGRVIPRNSDLEDLEMVDSDIYLLASRGALFRVSPGQRDTTGTQVFELGLEGKNDFETLYYDPETQGLILICKTCAHEKGRKIRTAFRFDPHTGTFDSTAYFTISREEIKKLIRNEEEKFDPSAAAIHPINKRLYILSSSGHLLVITDTKGHLIEAYALNPDMFPQAEGIAFAPNGDMFISNEGKFGKPTLLLFPYQQKDSKQ